MEGWRGGGMDMGGERMREGGGEGSFYDLLVWLMHTCMHVWVLIRSDWTISSDPDVFS